MRILILCLLVCLPAAAQDTAKLKRDLNGFLKRLTAMESRVTALKRPTEKKPKDEVWYALDDQAEALDKEVGILLRDLKSWGAKNIPPQGLPGVGQPYNALVTAIESFATWLGARRSWAIAGAAQNIGQLAANEAKAGRDDQAQRDAVAAELKK
jgi:hypothetical protein